MGGKEEEVGRDPKSTVVASEKNGVTARPSSALGVSRIQAEAGFLFAPSLSLSLPPPSCPLPLLLSFSSILSPLPSLLPPFCQDANFSFFVAFPDERAGSHWRAKSPCLQALETGGLIIVK